MLDAYGVAGATAPEEYGFLVLVVGEADHEHQKTRSLEGEALQTSRYGNSPMISLSQRSLDLA
jgi:hypothetical protein